jgi:DNA-binding NarL/FixJ family response regulator
VISVLLVDDHRLVRAGLEQLIDADPEMTVVGSASDGSEALELADATVPDIVLMDLSMPGMDGIEATRRLLAMHPQAQVVVLTSFTDRDRVIDALDAGAVGYLLKDSEPAELLRGIRSALRGESPLDPRAARALLDARDRRRASSTLTDRERQVLALISRGLANKQIARVLGISERTVKAHVGSVFNRIGVSDRTSAALWAREHLHDVSP